MYSLKKTYALYLQHYVTEVKSLGNPELKKITFYLSFNLALVFTGMIILLAPYDLGSDQINFITGCFLIFSGVLCLILVIQVFIDPNYNSKEDGLLFLGVSLIFLFFVIFYFTGDSPLSQNIRWVNLSFLIFGLAAFIAGTIQLSIKIYQSRNRKKIIASVTLIFANLLPVLTFLYESLKK